MYDVIVIGGGPAGLQAALTLGRMHRTVLVLDSGSYRNAPAAQLHNFATHDGRAPSEYRRLARADLGAYPSVELREAPVTAVRPAVGGGFAVTLAGGEELPSAAVILATGVRDVLPDIPGVAELFGRAVHHCPFCHGHELAGGTVAIQGDPRAMHLAPMLKRITDRVLVLAHDWTPSDDERSTLERMGVDVRAGRIEKVVGDGDRAVATVAGDEVCVDGLFVASTFEQSAPFAAQLDLRLLDSGCVEVDAMGRTSEPGVFAAGDLAHHRDLAMPLSSVLAAAAAGQVAAGACVADLLAHG